MTMSGALAKVLVRTAPDKIVWASNWPHPSAPSRTASRTTSAMLDLLLDWAPDETVRRKILVDTPCKALRLCVKEPPHLG